MKYLILLLFFYFCFSASTGVCEYRDDDQYKCDVLTQTECVFRRGFYTEEAVPNHNTCPHLYGCCMYQNGLLVDDVLFANCNSEDGILKAGRSCNNISFYEDCKGCVSGFTKNMNLFSIFNAYAYGVVTLTSSSIVDGYVGGNIGNYSGSLPNPFNDYNTTLGYGVDPNIATYVQFNNTLTQQTSKELWNYYSNLMACNCTKNITNLTVKNRLTPGKYCKFTEAFDSLLITGVVVFDCQNRFGDCKFIIYSNFAINMIYYKFEYINGARPEDVVIVSNNTVVLEFGYSSGFTVISYYDLVAVYSNLDTSKLFVLLGQIQILSVNIEKLEKRRCLTKTGICFMPTGLCTKMDAVECSNNGGSFTFETSECPNLMSDGGLTFGIVIFSLGLLALISFIILWACISRRPNK